jgi:hypothetical protein
LSKKEKLKKLIDGEQIMSKKLSYIITIIGFCLLVAGCSSSGHLKRKYIGTAVNKNRLSSLENSGHHYQVTEHFDIEYDYSIDNNKKTITLDGALKYNKTSDESKFHSETVLLEVKYLEVIVVFADENGKINGIEAFFTGHGKNIFDPAQFKETFSFSDKYKYIFLSYSVYWRGN